MSAISTSSLALLTLEIAVKSIVVLVVVLMVTWFMRRSSAASRHLHLVIASGMLLALPLASLALPSWDLGLLPNPLERTVPMLEGQPSPGTIPGEGAPATPQPGRSPHESGSTPPASKARWLTWVLGIWMAGAIALLIRLAAGKAYGRRIARTAPPLRDPGLRQVTRDILRDLGIGRKIEIVESDRFGVPLVCGTVTPRLILPSQARDWPLERLRAVLRHELAHIKRNDVLTQTVAQFACCLYWLNPLAWILERRLFVERERACDDMVLSHDTKASDYAGHLMEVLNAMGTQRRSLWVMTTVSEGTDFKDRVLSVLDPRTSRGSPGLVHTAAVVLLALLVLLPLGIMSPWTSASEAAQTASSWYAIQSISAPGTVAGEEDRPEPPTAPDAEVKDGDASTLQALIETLRDDPDATVREHAASALGRLGDRRAVPALIEALGDGSALVREHAASALGLLRDPRSVEPLMEVLRRDRDATVREHAASALGRLGDQRAAPALTEALRDESAVVREHAASALGKLAEGRATR